MSIVTEIKRLNPNEIIVYIGYMSSYGMQRIYAVIGETYDQISREVTDRINNLGECFNE